MPKGNWREFDESLAIARPEVSPSIRAKEAFKVRVQRVKGGKAGKVVTVITGLNLDLFSAKKLLKLLKASCGSGGTVKDDFLELQGDHMEFVLKFLEDKGYRPKRSGG